MARNKNATALFDVIHSAKKPPKGSVSGSIPTPRWWGKNKSATELAAIQKPEKVGRQQSWLAAAKRSVSTPPPIAVAPEVIETPVHQAPAQEVDETLTYEMPIEPVAEVVLPPSAPIKPKARFVDRFVNRTPKAVPAPAQVDEIPPPETAYPPLPEFPDVIDEAIVPETEMKADKSQIRSTADRNAAVAVDYAAGDVRFRLSYGGIIAICFILLMILAIAFIAGKQMAAGTAINDKPNQLSDPTSALMAAVAPTKLASNAPPINPDVVNVPTGNIKPVVSAPAPPATAEPVLPVRATRDIGMIYIVLQSYADQETAEKACTFANKAGVPCTLVQGLTDWAPRDWYSVVGLQPFTRHDPTLAEHERTLTNLGMKFTNKIYNQFEPQAYTWRADSDEQTQ